MFFSLYSKFHYISILPIKLILSFFLRFLPVRSTSKFQKYHYQNASFHICIVFKFYMELLAFCKCCQRNISTSDKLESVQQYPAGQQRYRRFKKYHGQNASFHISIVFKFYMEWLAFYKTLNFIWNSKTKENYKTLIFQNLRTFTKDEYSKHFLEFPIF